MKYMQDDRVVYIGEKFPELRAAVGFIVSPMGNQPDVYVVDFGGEGYVVSYKSINPYKPTGADDKVPTVMPVRRRRTEDEE